MKGLREIVKETTKEGTEGEKDESKAKEGAIEKEWGIRISIA